MIAAPKLSDASGQLVTARGGERGIMHRSADAHVQYWSGDDIPVEVHSERLLRAYGVWGTARTDDLAHLRDLITGSDADGDMLLFLRVGTDYLVVDQGADHVRHIGKDLRGVKISQFNAAVSPVLKELYDEAIETKQAIYCRFVSDLAPNSYFWEGLFLPVRGDDSGEAQFVLNYNRPIDSKADILQMILDRSPVGMIAAVPDRRPRWRATGRTDHLDQRSRQGDPEAGRQRQGRQLHSRNRSVAAQCRKDVARRHGERCRDPLSQ
jgi:hypothetical protein